MTNEDFEQWKLYTERARFLIQNEYVNEKNVEALAKKLHSIDEKIREGTKDGIQGTNITNTRLYD